MAGIVESAIRSKISQRQVLMTPDLHKSAPFIVDLIDKEGIILLFGKRKTRTRLTWELLEGIPAFLKGKGWVEIGTVFYT